jgi:hypothetical protein
MSRWTEAVVEFFTGEGWPVDQLADELFETSFDGESGAWPCHVHLYDEDERVVFVSTHPNLVPDDRRVAAAEFCNRANFGLAIGNFELDHDSGEIRFRTSFDALDVASDATADVNLVRNIATANVVTMDQYLPALDAVLGGAEAAAAVAAVEDDDDEPADDEPADEEEVFDEGAVEET